LPIFIFAFFSSGWIYAAHGKLRITFKLAIEWLDVHCQKVNSFIITAADADDPAVHRISIKRCNG
jgi:hypothetical protein